LTALYSRKPVFFVYASASNYRLMEVLCFML
jgi:hypothetical protein